MNVGISVPLPAYLVDVGFRRYLDAGATRVVVRPATVKTESEMASELTRIAEAVLR